MTRYVKIYCAEQARKDSAAASAAMPKRRETFGRCFAQRLAGAWFCCCCGKAVKVVKP